jgi:hypothetical protein
MIVAHKRSLGITFADVVTFFAAPRTALVWEAALRPAGHPSIEARTAAAATAIGKKLWVFGGVGNFRHMSAFNLGTAL